jgi:F-type H+-transporting ATPase subunit gamma
MAAGKEIRGKIKSVENTKKITKAMEMVAASKMRKAQERMRAARPYAEKIRNLAANLSQATPEYKHPFMVQNDAAKPAGFVVVSTDKGLCGGLNTNILRQVLTAHKAWKAKGIDVDYVAIGGKGLGFLQRMGGNVVASVVQLGDRPHLDKMVGPVKSLIDEYLAGKVDEVHVFFTTFINTMRQEPRQGRIIPIPHQFRTPAGEMRKADIGDGTWDYIYEPDARELLDGMMRRYLESTVFQMVNENMASEQSARMVAMKAASDNAGKIINELQLIYNKTRQAAITKELSEIVGGAAAV